MKRWAADGKSAKRSVENQDLRFLFRFILSDLAKFEIFIFRTTFHLAMSLLDRYTYYRNIIPKSQLQTLGTSCLFLAAKMEEVNPPDIYRLVEYSDGAVTIDDLVKLVSNNFKQLILTDPNSIYKLLVLSPSPWGYSSVVEHSTADREVPGSNPGVPLIFFLCFCEK